MKEDGRWTEVLTRLDGLLDRAGRLLDGLDPSLRPAPAAFERHWAFRWERHGAAGKLAPIEHPHLVDLEDLVGIDDAKEVLVRNTAQFVAGGPANDVLLWGERGNGKSSCIKGLLKPFAPAGLRLVEVRRWDLLSLPALAALLREVPFRFVVFCDDLSFGEREDDYRVLKTLLDGGLEERPANVRIYATSNRRHLMPEPMSDNTGVGEIHPEEAVSEKLGLADRFGVRLGFPRFDQERYLAVIDHLAVRLGILVDRDRLHEEALRWAMESGHRSGRVARQFLDDLAGRLRLA
ncbi:MAG TPA: ATP-binding protein [Candidatus Deferrimicrobiaceae bacterium]|nr:ATP-binding protein [Candidatus Deferrimicrobiaceae bacterium]